MNKIFVGNKIGGIVQEAYTNYLEIPKNCETRLKGVLTDSLAHPGGLTRACLTYQILNQTADTTAALPMAIAVEYFHTASLLLDDLPCMDDAFTRRGQVCPHRIYGEAACILGALAFINRGYALIWQAMTDICETRRKPALALLEQCLGVAGVINGQSLDVHFKEGSQNEADVADIAEGKTVAMIRLSLVVPGLMLGASDQELDLIEALSSRWGAAYQLLDDLKDVLHDQSSEKTAGRDELLQRPNMVLCVGLDGAWQRLDVLLSTTEMLLEELLQMPHHWGFLCDLQRHLSGERARLMGHALAA